MEYKTFTNIIYDVKLFIKRAILILLVLLGVLSCSPVSKNQIQPSKTISSIVVTPASSSIPIGVITQFQATAIYSDKSKQDVTNLVTWSSESPIATVSNATNSHGVVTPISAGTTNIKASLNSISGNANLIVNTATLQSLSISSNSSVMLVGTNQQLTATGFFSDGSNRNMTLSVIWSVNDNNLASISNAPGSVGLLNANSNGEVVVSISSLLTNTTKSNKYQYNKNISSSTATLKILIINSPLKSIEINPANYKMYVGTEQQYNAKAILEDGTNFDITSSVTWSEPNGFINKQGYLTAKFATNTSITATLGTLSGSTNLTIVSATLKSIGITPVNPTTAINFPLKFTAMGIYSDGGTHDITTEATWFSSATNIATIDNADNNSGLATPIAAGSTNITATLNGVTSAISILTVSSASLQSIQISPTNPSIYLDLTKQFTATGIYSDMSTQDITTEVTWFSSATNIATIDNADNNAGLATPIAAGSTNITATLNGITSAISTLTVYPSSLQSIQISPTNPSLYLGTTQQFLAEGIYIDAGKQNITNKVTWTSSNLNVATISNANGNQGLATPIAAGSTNITATFNGITSAISTLTFSNAPLTSIEITPDIAAAPLGTFEQYTATGIYSDGGNEDITAEATWSSSNPNFATISNANGSQGLATPIAAGLTNITASLNGIISNTGTLTVPHALLTSIAITPANATAPLLTFKQYKAIGTYSDGSTENITDQVTWISSNPNFATISNTSGSKGLATPITEGLTNITACLNGIISNAGTLTVSHALLTSIAITPANALAPLGTYEQYKAIGTYSDGTTENITNQVTWISSNPNLATISNTSGSQGLATPITEGLTNIIAWLNGIISNIGTLTVDPALLTSIVITPANATVPAEALLRYTATGIYTDGITADITNQVIWFSSQPDIAKISNAEGSKGIAKTRSVGTTNISASLFGIPSNIAPLKVD